MALNDTESAELLAKVKEIHTATTSRVLDSGDAGKYFNQREILRRVLVIARRSEARETALTAALEAVTANLGEAGTTIIAKVDAALAAVAELDDDLPEGEEPEPPATA